MTDNKIKAILSSIENNCFESRFMNSGFSDEDITRYCDEIITVTNDDISEIQKSRLKRQNKLLRDKYDDVPFELKIPRRDLGIFKNQITRYSGYFHIFNMCMYYRVKNWGDVKRIVYSKYPVIDMLEVIHGFTKNDCQRVMDLLGDYMAFYLRLDSKYTVSNLRNILNDDTIDDQEMLKTLAITAWSYADIDVYGDYCTLRNSNYPIEIMKVYFGDYTYYKAEFPDVSSFMAIFPINTNPIYIKLYKIIDIFIAYPDKHGIDSIYLWSDYSVEAATLIVDKYNHYKELVEDEDDDEMDRYSFDFIGEIIRSSYSIERIRALFEIYDFNSFKEDIISCINELACPVDVINEIAHCQDDVIDKLVEYWEIFTNNPTVEDIKAFRLYGDDNYEVDFPHGFNAENFINWYNEKRRNENV